MLYLRGKRRNFNKKKYSSGLTNLITEAPLFKRSRFWIEPFLEVGNGIVFAFPSIGALYVTIIDMTSLFSNIIIDNQNSGLYCFSAIGRNRLSTEKHINYITNWRLNFWVRNLRVGPTHWIHSNQIYKYFPNAIDQQKLIQHLLIFPIAQEMNNR